MFDPFGSRRQLVVNTKNFQKNLTFLKDYRDLINGIYFSSSLQIRLERSYEFCSHITLHLSAHIINESLRYWLNEFSDTFYQRKHPFIDDNDKKTQIDWVLNRVQNELFHDNNSRLLYQKLIQSGHIDPCEFVTNCLGISKDYIPTNDDVIYFSNDLILKTCFLNNYRGGGYKDKFTCIEERDFYFKILLEELNKI